MSDASRRYIFILSILPFFWLANQADVELFDHENDRFCLALRNLIQRSGRRYHLSRENWAPWGSQRCCMSSCRCYQYRPVRFPRRIISRRNTTARTHLYSEGCLHSRSDSCTARSLQYPWMVTKAEHWSPLSERNQIRLRKKIPMTDRLSSLPEFP